MLQCVDTLEREPGRVWILGRKTNAPRAKMAKMAEVYVWVEDWVNEPELQVYSMKRSDPHLQHFQKVISKTQALASIKRIIDSFEEKHCFKGDAPRLEFVTLNRMWIDSSALKPAEFNMVAEAEDEDDLRIELIRDKVQREVEQAEERNKPRKAPSRERSPERAPSPAASQKSASPKRSASRQKSASPKRSPSKKSQSREKSQQSQKHKSRSRERSQSKKSPSRARSQAKQFEEETQTQSQKEFQPPPRRQSPERKKEKSPSSEREEEKSASPAREEEKTRESSRSHPRPRQSGANAPGKEKRPLQEPKQDVREVRPGLKSSVYRSINHPALPTLGQNIDDYFVFFNSVPGTRPSFDQKRAIEDPAFLNELEARRQWSTIKIDTSNKTVNTRVGDCGLNTVRAILYHSDQEDVPLVHLRQYITLFASPGFRTVPFRQESEEDEKQGDDVVLSPQSPEPQGKSREDAVPVSSQDPEPEGKSRDFSDFCAIANSPQFWVRPDEILVACELFNVFPIFLRSFRSKLTALFAPVTPKAQELVHKAMEKPADQRYVLIYTTKNHYEPIMGNNQVIFSWDELPRKLKLLITSSYEKSELYKNPWQVARPRGDVHSKILKKAGSFCETETSLRERNFLEFNTEFTKTRGSTITDQSVARVAFADVAGYSARSAFVATLCASNETVGEDHLQWVMNALLFEVDIIRVIAYPSTFAFYLRAGFHFGYDADPDNSKRNYKLTEDIVYNRTGDEAQEFLEMARVEFDKGKGFWMSRLLLCEGGGSRPHPVLSQAEPIIKRHFKAVEKFLKK